MKTQLAILDALDSSLVIHQVHKYYRDTIFRKLDTEHIEEYITEVLGYSLSNIEWSLVKSVTYIDDSKKACRPAPYFKGAK